MKGTHTTTKTIQNSNKGTQGGFTLLEILIAMAILSIAFIALAGMQVTATVTNSTSNQLTTGVALAQDKMEKLLSLDYDDNDLLDTNVENNDDLESASDTDGHSDQVGVYARTWNVADDLPVAGTKTVMVIVTWGPGDHVVYTSSIVRQRL
jgi:prepilin-type N-terminal cleavage/methylation domain-containing protein